MIAVMKAKVLKKPKPQLNSKALVNSFIASLTLAILSFFTIFYFFSKENSQNDYQSPAQREMRLK
jgi:hypothetical protein